MKKVTLSFPNHDSLWSFKDKSKAINVTVTPRRNTISGPFSSEEVDIAVQQFQAIRLANASATANTSANRSAMSQIETRTPRPSFISRFHQLLAVINL
ncbi:MAG: hypothetical protein ACXVBH_15410 [Flavisolibacter sp.]